MIVTCPECGKRYADRLGACPFCAKAAPERRGQAGAAPAPGATGRRRPLREQSFYPALWVLAGGFLLGGGMLVAGLYGVVMYKDDTRIGGLVCAGLGLAVLLVMQVKITVAPSAVRVQHLVFARSFPIAEIADVVHLTTVTTQYGVESDRVTSVKLQLRDGREVHLRPAESQVEDLIAAIQQARGVG